VPTACVFAAHPQRRRDQIGEKIGALVG